MKKVRKGKKSLIILIAAIIAIAIIAIILIFVFRKKPVEPGPTTEQRVVIPLPETVYSDMQVRNIQMEYLRDNDETMVSMEIDNTTDVTVTDEALDAILIGPDDNVLGRIQTLITSLNPGEQYSISVVLKGDLTATKQIKLEKK